MRRDGETASISPGSERTARVVERLRRDGPGDAPRGTGGPLRKDDDPTMTLLAFILVLGIVVFVHEFGHYAVGRLCGIRAEVFSIGFGRELFGWTDRRGTRWKIAALPLGGYVQFRGDANPASGPDDAAIQELTPEERRTTLQGAPLWARTLTILAGPFANFAFTVVVAFFLALAAGAPSAIVGAVSPGGAAEAAGLREGDRIVELAGTPVEDFASLALTMRALEDGLHDVVVERGGGRETLSVDFDRPALIQGVSTGGAADQACLRSGDLIVSIDGQSVERFGDIRRVLEASLDSAGEPQAVTVAYLREGVEAQVALTPQIVRVPSATEPGVMVNRVLLGVTASFDDGFIMSSRPVGFVEAAGVGLSTPGAIIMGTLRELGAIFAGESDGSSISGPVGIATQAGAAADAGILTFVQFVAILSTAIGLVNLFPIPILDGGHLVFYAAEAIRGRPLGERWIGPLFVLGAALLFFVMAFALTNDIAPIWASFAAQCPT